MVSRFSVRPPKPCFLSVWDVSDRSPVFCRGLLQNVSSARRGLFLHRCPPLCPPASNFQCRSPAARRNASGQPALQSDLCGLFVSKRFGALCRVPAATTLPSRRRYAQFASPTFETAPVKCEDVKTSALQSGSCPLSAAFRSPPVVASKGFSLRARRRKPLSTSHGRPAHPRAPPAGMASILKQGHFGATARGPAQGADLAAPVYGNLIVELHVGRPAMLSASSAHLPLRKLVFPRPHAPDDPGRPAIFL